MVLLLGRLDRNRGREITTRPAAVVLLCQSLKLRLVEISHYDNDAVLRSVVPIVELKAVVVVVGHVPDVFEKPERGVLIRVSAVGEIVHGFLQGPGSGSRS